MLKYNERRDFNYRRKDKGRTLDCNLRSSIFVCICAIDSVPFKKGKERRKDPRHVSHCPDGRSMFSNRTSRKRALLPRNSDIITGGFISSKMKGYAPTDGCTQQQILVEKVNSVSIASRRCATFTVCQKMLQEEKSICKRNWPYTISKSTATSEDSLSLPLSK